MNQNVIVFLIVLLSSVYSIGQTADTIHLEEVQTNRNQKVKIINVKTRGESSSLTGEAIKSAITRLDNIPSGQLSSIKFYFNHSTLGLFEPGDMEYRDLELGLLIFSVNADGSVGDPVTDSEIRFNVTANHRGSLELDLNPLYLNSEKSMYFGFEIFTKQVGKNLRIVVESSPDNPDTFYMKSWRNEPWSLLSFAETKLAIKMNLAVAILK